MKLLTLNAHSLQETDYLRRLAGFAEFVLREQPDLIALQEVNQSADAPVADESLLSGLFPAPGSDIPIRCDNHAAWTAYVLRQAGVPCSWIWLPVKRGYGRFDEGLALFSLSGSIAEADVRLLSRVDDYANWKTRKALGVRISGGEEWFYTIHMGWWNDKEEPFLYQWRALDNALSREKQKSPLWLMGDFNAPAEVRGQGYDCICDSGWLDTWLLARERHGCATMRGSIDGWREKGANLPGGMRIDHIFVSRPVPVLRASVVFDGTHQPQVSDHFGVFLETGNPSEAPFAAKHNPNHQEE